MEIVTSLISFAKDIKDRDKQLRNLTTQLNYVLYKAKSLIDKSSTADNYIHCYLAGIVKRADVMNQKMTQLLKEDNISMKEKIRFSLPFDKTKEQIKDLIEQLDKGCSDLKQHLDENNKFDAPPIENVTGKRRVNHSVSLFSNFSNELIRETSSHDVEEERDAVQEMGPTIQNDQLGQFKNHEVAISVELKGDEKILETIKQKCPQLLSYENKINIDDHDELLLFTLCRKYFIKAYKQLKGVFPDIDRLSTDKHFQIIWRRKQNATQQSLPEKEHINNGNTVAAKSQQNASDKKNISTSKLTARKSQGAADQFLSFPNQNILQKANVKGVVLLIRDEKKTSYLMNGAIWQKCDSEIQIKNGDYVSGFIAKKGEQAVAPLYLQIRYSLPE